MYSIASIDSSNFRFHPDSLARHFDNHKNEFAGAYKTAQQYQKGAIAVIKGGEYFDSMHEENPTRIFYKKLEDDTYHFVATRKYTILSYHTREWHQIDKLKSSDKQKPAHKSLYNQTLSSSKNMSTIPKQPKQLISYSSAKSGENVRIENASSTIKSNVVDQCSQPKPSLKN